MEEEQSVVEASVDAEQFTPETPETPTDTGETVVQEAVDAPKPDANVGEAIKREVDRREAQLKKQYEQQMEDIRQENAYLDKQAQIYGYRDREEYKKALDAHLQQQQVEREAQRMGVDPDTYAQYFQPVNNQLTELQKELQTYKSQLTEREQQERDNQLWGSLYKEYPTLSESLSEGKTPEWYTPQMQQFVSRGYDPVDAYRLAHADTLFKQKEQEVLARVTGRDERQILPSNDQPNNVQFDPANMTDAQLDDISRRVRNGERITF